MESSRQQSRKALGLESVQWLSGVLAGALFWILLYSNLEWFAALSLQFAGMTRTNRFGEALYFFIYEVPKVLLLLTAVVFLMGVVHTFISAERTRALLSGRRTGGGKRYGGLPRHCNAFLFLLRSTAFHRLSSGGCAAGCYLFVSYCSSDDQ